MSARSRAGVEFAVIGGGLVGAAVAYGLIRKGRQVALLDEGDSAFRASRGNFGLVWAQGKGDKLEAYAPWARQGAALWPDFASELSAATDVDVELEQNGGFVFCLTEETLRSRADTMERLRTRSGLDYDVMTPSQIAHYMPGVSEHFAGATFSREDGHANPLKLLRALHAAISGTEGALRRGTPIERIEPVSGGYRLVSGGTGIECENVVLAAGLGNVALAETLGITLPIQPMRGQILVTERHERIMKVPSENVRQTQDGTFLLGGSWEDVGYDVSTTFEVTRDIAALAVRYFPFLKNVRLVRSWSALRILAPDNAPIYHELAPGAFLVTCHSGVSLAAIHADRVAGWLSEGSLPAEAAPFSLDRFS
ncbi:FAD-dependent oxidoreductase [Kaistia dalseonensis]|uniref:Glycine/D-amino acid oxidase-like deaminating enzyme n=1 Tax=Kaistia dalseonensis TaxID=410840 RepID=A0ABU0H676_9HYPH|nr:FAD-dependent oxidoreductase [Kaistia dalseonensis]MCX5494379.1 FAD-dependent oxidoreductase [Kaistia dalseonensis]MDQ0436961.1 glycine/D-amino acid oxidase-like deaminating enzyme [Kaistia dalseonensis]